MRQSKVWISIGIILLIALHAVPVLSAGFRKRTWPILDWAMYKDSRARSHYGKQEAHHRSDGEGPAGHGDAVPSGLEPLCASDAL